MRLSFRNTTLVEFQESVQINRVILKVQHHLNDPHHA